MSGVFGFFIRFKYKLHLDYNMKIFFSGSIRGGRQDVDIYKEIVELLMKHGELLSEFNADKNLEEKERKAKTSDKEICTNDIRLIRESDILVAEVTTPSIGVGYEIGLAEALKKRVICLFRKDEKHRLSAMISGNKFKVIEYETIQDLEPKLQGFLVSAGKK